MASSSPAAGHTFGPSCRLNPVTPPEPTDGLQDIPSIKAQFFYSSPIPIDDPLSAATIVGSAESKASKLPLRPFSPGDNIALERAWLGFSSDRDRRNHSQAQRNRSPSPSLSQENAQKLATIVAQLAAKHKEKHDREGQPPAAALSSSSCCPELLIDASAELQREFCAVTRRRQQSLDHDRVIEGVMDQLTRLRSNSDVSSQAVSTSKPVVVQLGTSPAGAGKMPSFGASADGQVTTTTTANIPVRPPVVDDALSRKPFARVESNTKGGVSSTKDKSPTSTQSRHREVDPQTATRTPVDATDLESDAVEISVGISRLHKVHLPILQMRPIYWSPVNDISMVLRATWFYR